ncbi:Ig-like domain-containing protein [Micromonospora sp. NPDC049559]|uniref:L,D-transpeptidase n=1 Tax=Micromonospora sp. NPDC049559 TaxID=3155923 RepID=UPI0034496818
MRADRNALMPGAHGRWRAGARLLVPAVLAGALALSGCSKGGDGPAWQGGRPTPTAKASATITTPAADAKDVPASTEIVFTTKDATNSTVELKDASGKAVEGTLSKDGKSWLPNGALKYGTTYTATVNVTDSDGKTATATNTFTTMAKPSNVNRATSFLGDGAVVGVGMPLIVKFNKAVPQDYRDDVQRRLTVKSDPPQEGGWRWISPTEVHFRPKVFWKANSKISYRMQLGGLPMGNNVYGSSDVTVDIKTGSAFIMSVDNKTKQMTVTKDGQVIKTLPVSLGKPSTPSSSGTTVVMEKFKKTTFDTRDDPDPANRYVTDIDWAQRLTYGGEFIHAAPWSEGKQGRENVSHGCVNVSEAMGEWLFNQTRIGDPITVKNTERKLQNGNGWTDWNMSWDEFIKGSAIPYEEPSDESSGDPTPATTP